MDTTSTACEGVHLSKKNTCDYSDWQDLKDLFARAAASYEVNDVAETLPLLRGVIHECHRFLVIYPDPSILFTSPVFSAPQQPEKPVSVSAATAPRERLDWNYNDPEVKLPQAPSTCAKFKRCVEIPTSFHTIMGTALFLFGNLISQEPQAVLPGEPDTPAPYWLAALDVFETGENLPSRTNSQGCCCPEDWRMAIVWGRTLVALADETITRSRQAMSDAGDDGSFMTAAAEFAADEHNWPADSPFATIASRRPPVTRRMSLSTASPNDLLVLAMDQFSRGIFHMPHLSSSSCSSKPTFVNGAPSAAPNTPHFSRAKELFTLASEVLFVAEQIDDLSERRYWASWADSVFNQLKNEANMDTWKAPITKARARCWLIVGTSRAEELEESLENGEMDILQTEDASDARDALKKAISFLERAVDLTEADDEEETKEFRSFLTEALLTIANLIEDESQREAYYSQAQTVAGDDVNLDFMDVDESH